MSNKKTTEQKRSSPAETEHVVCPVIGIGASAGGVAALRAFVAGIAAESGLAYVVIQHVIRNTKATWPASSSAIARSRSRW